MANNTTRTYTIEVNLDNARNQLADATKKLVALDAQLDGISKDSDAGKKIVAEMAAAASSVEKLTKQVGGLEGQLDALKPGTVGALRQEVKDLTAQLNQATEGTAEYNQILVKLGTARGGLKGIKEDLLSLNPEKQIQAFANFGQGIVGAFAVGQTALSAFGLESGSLDEVAKRTQSYIAVLQGLESVRSALDNDTVASIKNTLQMGKAYITAGEGATAGGKATRAALISTGIGLIVVLVGVLIANWDRLTASVKGSETFFTKVKAIASGLFDSAIASAKNFAGIIVKLFEGDLSGAAAKAKNFGKEVGAAYAKGYEESVFESNRKVFEAQIAANARLIEIAKAQGKNTFKQEEQNLLDRLKLQKQGTEDEKTQYLDLQKQLAVLRVTNAKKEKEDSLAATLARLDSQIALEEAKGNEAFKKQLAREKNQLDILRSAPDPNLASIIAQQGKIDTLIAQHDTQQAEKKRARLEQAQQNELAILEKEGKQTLDLRVKFAEQLLALDTGNSEKALARRKADQQALKLLLIEQANFEKDLAQKHFEARQDEQADLAESRNAFNEGASQGAKDAIQRATDDAKRIPSLGQTILEKLFGVSKEKSEALKGQISEAFAGLRDVAVGFANQLLSESINALDAQIQATQDRLSQVSQQLDQSRSAAQQDEAQLAESTGAKRDYLLQKIAKERAETERLAAAKAKAAADEKKQQAEKEKLEKKQQQLIAATTLVTNISTAASAVDAGVKAVAGASALPFPASIPAIFAALAAVVGAVASAKSLSKTFADGGTVYGPSHAAGGIQMWHKSGAHLGEFEGGEHITPTDATARNAGALELIRTAGRTRTLAPADFAAAFPTVPYHVLPPPAGYYPGRYANGGTLPSAPIASTPSANSGLLEAQARTNELLAQVVGHTADSAGSNKRVAGFGPPVLAFGYEAEAKRRQISAELDSAANSAAL